MSNVQNLLDERIYMVENMKRAHSCLSAINLNLARKKCEKQIRKSVEEGGRDILKTAFDHFPYSLFK